MRYTPVDFGEQQNRSTPSSSSALLLSSLELSDTQVYEPEMRALLGTASHFCEVVVLKLRTVPIGIALSQRMLHTTPFSPRKRFPSLRSANAGNSLRQNTWMQFLIKWCKRENMDAITN